MYPINYPENIKTKIELQGEIDKITFRVGGFNVPFAIVGRSSTQNTLVYLSKDIEELDTVYEVFGQQVFMAHFLCARHYSRCAGHIIVNKSQPSLSS